MSFITRLVKGTALTWAELDANFTQLASSAGASIVKWTYAFAGSVSATVQNWISWQDVNVFGFMSIAQIADVQTRTATVDCTSAVQNAANALTNGGVLKFPAGKFLLNGVVNILDKTVVQGSGIGATLLQAPLTNTTGVLNCVGGGTFIGCTVRDLSIDMSHGRDITSTVVTSGVFVQWNYSAYCVNINGVVDALLENVRLSNAGYGATLTGNTNAIVRNVHSTNMQWDGLYTQDNTGLVLVDGISISTVGRNGFISWRDGAHITVSNFDISDCLCEGIEVEQNIGSDLKHPTISKGRISNCGTFVQLESYALGIQGSIDSVRLDTVRLASSSGAFGAKSIGYADTYYNLNTGAGWTGTPTFPVPNTPGTWGNTSASGIKCEVPAMVTNCFFNSLSTTALMSAGEYACGFYEQTASTNIQIKDCQFVSSNIVVTNGENRIISDNIVTNSIIAIGQTGAQFTNNPSTIVQGNIITGSGINITDDVIIIGNAFRNINGIAIQFGLTGSNDGKTKISYNTFIDSRGGSAAMTTAISIPDATASMSHTIEGNYLYGATTSGINISDQNNDTEIVIRNNTIDTCVVGLLIQVGLDDIVKGNIFKGNSTADIELYGNYTTAANNLRIIENQLQSATAVWATIYTALPTNTKFVGNEYTSGANAFLAGATPVAVATMFTGGLTVVQNNWTF